MKIIGYPNGKKSKISDIEKHFKIKLPQDYKDFLNIYNGGETEEDAFIYVEDLDEYMIMGNFFGIDIDEGFADIYKINEEYNDDIPPNSLLIGSDMGSGLILLIQDGENDGIWYYDHSYFFEQSSDEENTYFICETFTEFLEILENTKLPEE
ncbi:SMI1/KNR4 family protein [Capnocytophaga stomatis]|nr:SMI1/KNR4 family protein [Capnocytophaga stomatis]GIM50349.1 SMI1/KNR4 family protein [Capnocytophaga stomatis]